MKSATFSFDEVAAFEQLFKKILNLRGFRQLTTTTSCAILFNARRAASQPLADAVAIARLPWQMFLLQSDASVPRPHLKLRRPFGRSMRYRTG